MKVHDLLLCMVNTFQNCWEYGFRVISCTHTKSFANKGLKKSDASVDCVCFLHQDQHRRQSQPKYVGTKVTPSYTLCSTWNPPIFTKLSMVISLLNFKLFCSVANYYKSSNIDLLKVPAPGVLLVNGNLTLHTLKSMFEFSWHSMERFFLTTFLSGKQTERINSTFTQWTNTQAANPSTWYVEAGIGNASVLVVGNTTFLVIRRGSPGVGRALW